MSAKELQEMASCNKGCESQGMPKLLILEPGLGGVEDLGILPLTTDPTTTPRNSQNPKSKL